MDCESTVKTLHVHHKYYRRGLEPWEYPSSALITLCLDCHKEHKRGDDPYDLMRSIIDRLLDEDFPSEEICDFAVSLFECLEGRAASFESMRDYILSWGGEAAIRDGV